jgi:hypothetical protein
MHDEVNLEEKGNILVFAQNIRSERDEIIHLDSGVADWQ